MIFVKRDLILLAGVFLFMLGLIPFMSPFYAAIIATGIFFGIKLFVKSREKFLKNQIGEGFCAICGEKVKNKKCPNCDNSKKSV